MSNIVKVRLTENDQFVVTDPDTGREQTFSSIQIHSSSFIVDLSVLKFFCEAFQGKTECECSVDALERIRGITDFNCLVDEVRF